MTASQGRLLKVLIIDDQLTDVFLTPDGGFSAHLKLTPVRSWADAQSIVANDGELEGADIVLIDVSLETDTGIAKARGNDPSFLPVGPLLALPFIAKRSVMTCVIYSGHLLSDKLPRHPLFLLPMGLILARTEGLAPGVALHSTYLSEGSGRKRLDEEVKRLVRDGASNPAGALEKALRGYRERIEVMTKDQDLSVYNRRECLSRIVAQIDECSHGDVLVNDDLDLTLVGRNWKDTLSLRSLFADRLNWAGMYASEEWLCEVKDWIEGLGQSPVELAIEAIRRQEELEEANHSKRPFISDVILQRFQKTLSQEDLTELLRLTVLFANVWAIENPTDRGRVAKQSVYKRLGDSVDANIYFNLFGERGPTGESKGPFKRLRPLSLGNDKNSKCFLGSSSTISEEDYEAIQRYRSSEGFSEWRTPPFKLTRTIGTT